MSYKRERLAYFERLNESPEQDADRVSLPQQLDESRCSEQSQEAETDETVLKRRTMQPRQYLYTNTAVNLVVSTIFRSSKSVRAYRRIPTSEEASTSSWSTFDLSVSCTYLLTIHQGAASISSFASYNEQWHRRKKKTVGNSPSKF